MIRQEDCPEQESFLIEGRLVSSYAARLSSFGILTTFGEKKFRQNGPMWTASSGGKMRAAGAREPVQAYAEQPAFRPQGKQRLDRKGGNASEAQRDRLFQKRNRNPTTAIRPNIGRPSNVS